MNKHIGDARVRRADYVFHTMRDFMAFTHGHRAVYLYVEINVIVDSHFPYEALVQIVTPGTARAAF